MRRIFVILVMVYALFCSANATADPRSGEATGGAEIAASPVPAKQCTPAVRVLLARSCVGEAGFHAVNECIAIAWVYAKRAKTLGWPISKVIRKYSAAVKPHGKHERPWLFGLNAVGDRPASWPRHLSWRRHRGMWLDLLSEIDRWYAGDVPDPVPDADHYGSRQDARAALYVRRWKRLNTPGFQNWFFDSGV